MSVTRFIHYIHFINFIFNLKREIFFDIFRQNLTAGGIIVYFSNGQNGMCYIIKFHVNHRYVMYVLLHIISCLRFNHPFRLLSQFSSFNL